MLCLNKQFYLVLFTHKLVLSGRTGAMELIEEVRQAIRIAFTYIGTVVGAGFASGQEIFRFFVVFGYYGFWGILLSILLFSWLGTRMMVISAKLKATSYEVLNDYLFGQRFGRWMSLFVGIVLFGVITAMLSGTGAIVKEQFGYSFHLGVIITSILAFFVIIRGMEGILSINSLVVPFMLGFVVLVAINSFWLSNASELHYFISVSNQNWLISALTYVAFNLAMSQAVLVPLGAEIKNEKILRMGGWMGGLGLGLMLLISYFAMQLYFLDIKQLEIPMAFVIHKLGVIFKIMFLAVMWGEIFTTLIGNIYGLAVNIQQVLSWRLSVIVALIFLTAYLCSLVGFPTLISYLYPAFGYCGLMVILLLAVRKIPQV